MGNGDSGILRNNLFGLLFFNNNRIKQWIFGFSILLVKLCASLGNIHGANILVDLLASLVVVLLVAAAS